MSITAVAIFAASLAAGASAQERMMSPRTGSSARMMIPPRPSPRLTLPPPPNLARRPANRPCTEVILRGLPPGAEVQAAMVLVRMTTSAEAAEEEAVFAHCAGLNERAGVRSYTAGAEALEAQAQKAVLDYALPNSRPMLRLSFHPAASRMAVTADGKGTVRFHVPREDLEPNLAVARGYTFRSLTASAVVKTAGGDTAGRSSIFLISNELLKGRSKSSLNVGSGKLKSVVGWFDASGAPLKLRRGKLIGASGQPVG